MDLTEWAVWTGGVNPNSINPWEWSFNFPEGTGYYEFYSIGRHGSVTESAPSVADASCYYTLVLYKYKTS